MVCTPTGPLILNPDGTLNRRQLGQIIFTDAAEKRWLEQQIHPFVREQFATAMATLASEPVVVQTIPLLFEADLTDQVTEIWVVTCPESLQLERLMARDQLALVEAQNRIRNQWPLVEKVQRADVVLENQATLEALYQQVDQALFKAS
jgi:dephospho-CoA kinase